MKLRRAIILLPLTLTLAACFGGGGDEFVGKWVSPKFGDQVSMEISRNGGSFLLKSTFPNFMNGKPQSETMPAVYKDGMLHANHMVTVQYVIDKSSGNLIGGGQTFKKVTAQ